MKPISLFLLLNFCVLSINFADSPYAPRQIGKSPGDDNFASYSYDSSGNRLNNARMRQSIAMGLVGKPVKVTGVKGDEVIKYGLGATRYLRKHADGRKTLYIQGIEYCINTDSSVIKIHTNGYSPIAQVEVTQNNQPEHTYFVQDHLGSPIVSINDSSRTIHRRFEPWGLSVNLEGVAEGYDNNNTVTAEAIPGFTGHELIASADFVHMNGRVYDPVVGLFTQPDFVLNTPLSLPTLNRYSYVMNNTLLATDPTGYMLEHVHGSHVQIMHVAQLDPKKVILQETKPVRWRGFKFDSDGSIIASGADHTHMNFIAELSERNLEIKTLHLESESGERFAPKGTGTQAVVDAIDLAEKRLDDKGMNLPLTSISISDITERNFTKSLADISFLSDVNDLSALHAKIIETPWGKLIKSALDRKGYVLEGHKLEQGEEDFEWNWKFDISRKGPYHDNTLEPPVLRHILFEMDNER